MNRLPSILLACLSIGLFAQLAYAGGPSVRLVPGRARIDGRATLIGSGLPINTYFQMVVAVPNAAHAKAKALVPQLVHSDGAGNLRASIKVPVIIVCGSATLYLTAANRSVTVPVHFTLTGCRLKGVAPPPPAPPTSHKHSHKKP